MRVDTDHLNDVAGKLRKARGANGRDRTKLPAAAGVACPLAEVEAFLGRFVAYPSEHARVAHVLWIAHTHLMDAWESTPRIAFLSPEPGSGKSRALEVSELLVPRPVQAVNVTPAYLFRKVGAEEGLPTVLFDEVDTVFGPKAKDNEEVRGLLNAGHRRGASAGRCVVVGRTVRTEEIPAYCAVALAGLGDLPDTILTRSVIVRMRRRAPNEHVESFRRRVTAGEGDKLRERIEAWCASVYSQCDGAWPQMPPGVADRDADVWEPLLAVADAAGGAWPQRARAAAETLVADSKASTPSLGVRLLVDLRTVFGERDMMSTEDILRALAAIDEAPWSDIRGKPLDSRGLAHRLRVYGIKSQNARVSDERVLKHYVRADLADAWARYLPPPSPDKSATAATAAREGGDTEGEPGSNAVAAVADAPPFVADAEAGAPYDVAAVAAVALPRGRGETALDPDAEPV